MQETTENRKKKLTIFEVTIFCSSHARPISTFGILHSGARKAFRKQSNQACYNIQNKKVIFLILKKYDVHTVLARLLTQRDPLLSTPHPNMNHNKPYHPFFASCEIWQNFTFYTKNWPSVFANDVHSSNLITQITTARYFTPPAPTWIIICSDASFFLDREKIEKKFCRACNVFLQNF